MHPTSQTPAHGWAKEFSDALHKAGVSPQDDGYAPRWYRGDDWQRIGAAGFAGAMGGAFAAAVSSASAAPSSHSGGGGGGGGSSGCGGGGGGGGGW